MQIEQLPPNKPNFALIVGLFVLTILMIMVLALLFVHFGGHHMTFHHAASS